ncbi:MAG: MIP/aquaporin family protein [Candidatus Poseidoniales archaeon]
MKPYFAEAAGTFGLVFFGCGSIILAGEGLLWTMAVCFVFGIAVWAMISIFGNTSGAHINPAVSVAFCIEGRLPKLQMLGYVTAQCLGAIIAGYSLLIMSGNSNLGSTTTSLPIWQAFIIEVAITCLLMLSILWAAIPNASIQRIALVVGSAVAILAFIAGSFTGASMNPARSIGPAIPEGMFELLWMYLLAPIIGAILAVPLWNKISTKHLID